MNRPSNCFAEAMGDSSDDRPYQVKLSDEGIARLGRFPEVSQVSAFKKMIAIEKALCEPAPDDDDFVFGKYEMAIMQAMEPHILDQTWSPYQPEEGKAGACEKFVVALARVRYEHRISKILDPHDGRGSGVSLDRALETMLRGRQSLKEDVPVRQTDGGGDDGDERERRECEDFDGQRRKCENFDGERRECEDFDMERSECEDFDMERGVFDLPSMDRNSRR
ncbi:hypothetical protein E4U30_008445 [Claviceps sp. LM220 group G6]|nr:hypothetical protein E4U15_006326 [Claviceps sp. LM218 group G6]KAG6089143.1 hypothetical protein E4U30_008445 [Claviceps sp. LM220 group G6]